MLEKTYNPSEVEPRLSQFWRETGVYHFASEKEGPVYSIDTPPPTVSGRLHLGHVYSYSHPDFMARFWRMNGYNVYYPMGYDDNGLPTERLVEKRLGITSTQVGRGAFIEKCLEVSERAEKDYQDLWQRLGLSIDWRYTYRTIDDRSRRISQLSFLDLYRKGLAYRRQAPAIWCPECCTAIAQAELNDLERSSEFVTLAFRLEDGGSLPIATTRPEFLPACVAVFVHPEDARFHSLAGRKVVVPFFGQAVPILEDPGADPQKGTGAVMCCTFGDTADVAWWYTHRLPVIEAVGPDGRMTEAAGDLAGLPIEQARQAIKDALVAQGLILDRQPTLQSIRVHERCDTPVEYILARQWFIRVLDHKEELLKAGEQVAWHPAHMQARYRAWVENLGWDWCISRQRYYGVPLPVWYCQACGEVILAGEDQLPVDPSEQLPVGPCTCGSETFIPEQDVMDTWATSSLTPQIVGQWQGEDGPPGRLYDRLFPFSLRPQAHEIIRTWAFYTILKSSYHFGKLPWKEVLISGWGIAGEGMDKISKSRGGGPMAPMEMIERYSADAVRYWAASTAAGKDAVISEEKIQMGSKLVTKLWNVARFSQRFLEGYLPPEASGPPGPTMTPADRWILARTQQLIRQTTDLFQAYDYAAAKSAIESFFWRDLADNYLEMCKQRLYDEASLQLQGAQFALFQVLLVTLKLFAPLLPYVTEEIYLGLFARGEKTGDCRSIHISAWPLPNPAWEDQDACASGETLVEIATAVRRYKSEHNLSLGSEIDELQLVADPAHLQQALRDAVPDLVSVCRARRVEVVERLDEHLTTLPTDTDIQIAIEL
jgi:valyl-tRNA synthetase